MSVKNLCALCLQNGDLQDSHIIPKFVFRWQKKDSPIRTNQNVNLRVQDGLKYPLLCRNCEQIFSKWEKIFSEQIFIPLHSPEPVKNRINYRKWMLKFAVSVSWRVLAYYKTIDELKEYSVEQLNLINNALEIWRKFLLDKIPSPLEFEQHILPTDIITFHNTEDVSPFINRYLLRSCHFEIITSDESIIVVTKLCRIMLFGFVMEKNAPIWKGTKIRINKGEISRKDYRVPGQLFHYLNTKANQVHFLLDAMSDRQKEVVEEFRRNNFESFADSEISRAILQDVYMSGESAFSPAIKAKD